MALPVAPPAHGASQQNSPLFLPDHLYSPLKPPSLGTPLFFTLYPRSYAGKLNSLELIGQWKQQAHDESSLHIKHKTSGSTRALYGQFNQNCLETKSNDIWASHTSHFSRNKTIQWTLVPLLLPCPHPAAKFCVLKTLFKRSLLRLFM